MLAKAVQLNQQRPGTISPVLVIEPSVQTEVTLIVVCNVTSAATTFSVYHDDDGNTFNAATALYLDSPIAANETIRIELQHAGGGIQVSERGQLAVQTAVASALTFSVYGITTDITGYQS